MWKPYEVDQITLVQWLALNGGSKTEELTEQDLLAFGFVKKT